ncbi:MAG TPA: hypothetical protein VJR27_00940 [Candidatus Saccharimonadales bacterium]|nr:hypothetical protein [Candidatus Saccharimonadales bacterium]
MSVAGLANALKADGGEAALNPPVLVDPGHSIWDESIYDEGLAILDHHMPNSNLASPAQSLYEQGVRSVRDLVSVGAFQLGELPGIGLMGVLRARDRLATEGSVAVPLPYKPSVATIARISQGDLDRVLFQVATRRWLPEGILDGLGVERLTVEGGLQLAKNRQLEAVIPFRGLQKAASALHKFTQEFYAASKG